MQDNFIERDKMKKVIIFLIVFGLAIVFFEAKTSGLELTGDELENGFFYEEITNINKEEYEYEINKICRHENGYIVVGKAEDTNIEVMHLNFYITYPYIAYYNKDGLVWSYLDRTIGHGEYTDAVVVNGEVVAIGSYEIGDEVARLLTTRFNSSGNVKARVEFDADRTTFGHSILYENHSFYLVGTTNATHFLVDTNSLVDKIFILKLSEEFQKEKIRFIHNSDYSHVINACMANGIIYLFGRLSGDGEYNIETMIPVDVLFAIDTSFNNIDYTSISRDKYGMIACNEEGVYVIKSNDNLNSLQIFEYSERLEYVKQVAPFTSSNHLVTGISVSSSDIHEPVSIFITSSNGDSYDNYLSIGLGLDIKSKVTRMSKNENRAGGVFNLDGAYYLFSNINETNDVTKLIYINQVDGVCYCNGELCQGNAEEIDTSIYGTYNRKVTYSYHGLEINNYEPYIVPIRISIKDHGIYDREVKLEFNGIGYLNNEPIDSGYVVTKEGQYILEVRGKDEKKYFTFEVRKLAIDENSINLEEVSISFSKNSGVISKSASQSSEGFPNNNITLNNFSSEDNNNYTAIIIVALAGVFLGLFIPFERMHRKNKEAKDE